MLEVHDGCWNSLVGVGLAAALMAGAGCDNSKETSAPDEQAEQQATESDERESPSPETRPDTSGESETAEDDASAESESAAAEDDEKIVLEGQVDDSPVDDRELETFAEAYRVFKRKTAEMKEALKQAETHEEADQLAEKMGKEIGKAIEKKGMAQKRFHFIRKRLREGDEKLRSRISEMDSDLDLPDVKTQPDAGSP